MSDCKNQEGNNASYYKYFTDEEWNIFINYKHIAPKTAYELWWLENFTSHIEKLFPSNWTPNALTLIGNLALPLVGMLSIYITGTKYHKDDEKDPDY